MPTVTRQRFLGLPAVLLAGAFWLCAPVGGVAQEATFEVKKGYLSNTLRELVDGYGWALVWQAGEDRVIDHPFWVPNRSMEETLTLLLEMYEGQFVADLFEGNQVVLVDTPPARIAVDLPGAESESAAAPTPAAAGEELPYAIETDTDMRWELIEQADAAEVAETASLGIGAGEAPDAVDGAGTDAALETGESRSGEPVAGDEPAALPADLETGDETANTPADPDADVEPLAVGEFPAVAVVQDPDS